jgi:hypothetical protein
VGKGISIQLHHTETALKEPEMNIAKNMEAVFISAIAIIAATSIATAEVPARQPVASAAAAPFVGKMQVVTIVGKRLSAAEKAAAGQ